MASSISRNFSTRNGSPAQQFHEEINKTRKNCIPVLHRRARIMRDYLNASVSQCKWFQFHAAARKYYRWGRFWSIGAGMKMELKDKWVLITGASSGFGAAAARAFGAEGAKLLLGARRLDRLEQVVKEAKAAGAREAHARVLDVSQTPSVEAFLEWAKEKTGPPGAPGGGLHVLINNAGGAHGLDTVAQGKDRDWEEMLQTNVLGVLRMTRAALPLIPKDAGGSIINIGSVAGHVAYEGGAAYCAAKAGELQITRALRLELNGTGIRVCTVDPGLAETEFSLVRFKGDAARAKKVYDGTHPLTGEDIAEILVWVAARPAHVDIDEILVKPVDQAAVHKVFRRQ
jgi:NADP-dependent 3-hydroxy acid dehydrogenase YdfG